MTYSIKAFSFICLLTLLLNGCNSQTDAEKVQYILSQVSKHTSRADQIYQHSLSNMEHKRSQPLLLAETLLKDSEALDEHVMQLAVLGTDRLREIESKELKNNLYQGIEYTYSAYKAKQIWLHDAAVSIRSNDQTQMAQAIIKNQPELEKVEHRLMMAATAFGYVKAQVGLKEK